MHGLLHATDQRFWWATLAAFATSFVLSFIGHGFLLAPDYAGLQNVYRPPVFQPLNFSLLLLAQLIAAAAMTALYRFGIESKPYFGQGVRFGLLAAGISAVPYTLIGYAVTNITGALAVKQLILEVIVVTAMGIVIAWFHRK
jgi:hypothetical protein